jgi:hypothetical protein
VTLPELIRDVVAHLEAAGVLYMVTGSVASSYHGEPRATRDLDVVIEADRPSLSRLVERLRSGGLYVDIPAALDALTVQGQFNAIDASTGWKVDFIIRRDRAFSREEFARRMRADLLGTAAFVATPEDTIIAKLEWAMTSGSARQLADVSALLDVGRDTLDLEYIDRWADSLGVGDAWRAVRDAG